MISVPPAPQIVFMSEREGNPEIYKVDAQGETRLTKHPARDWKPCWSRAAGLVVFVSSRNGASDLFLMDEKGENLKPLTEDTFKDLDPAFSPDGQAVLFSSTRGGNSFDLFLVRTDGTNLLALAHEGPSKLEPAWSPDGKRIAFTGLFGDGRTDIFSASFDGEKITNLKNLTQSPDLNEHSPAFSPDGKTIVFSAAKEGRSDLWTIGAGGGKLERLTDGPGLIGHPSWSSDGKALAFDRTLPDRGGKKQEIWTLDLNTMIPTLLGGEGRRNADPAWIR